MEIMNEEDFNSLLRQEEEYIETICAHVRTYSFLYCPISVFILFTTAVHVVMIPLSKSWSSRLSIVHDFNGTDIIKSATHVNILKICIFLPFSLFLFFFFFFFTDCCLQARYRDNREGCIRPRSTLFCKGWHHGFQTVRTYMSSLVRTILSACEQHVSMTSQ